MASVHSLLSNVCGTGLLGSPYIYQYVLPGNYFGRLELPLMNKNGVLYVYIVSYQKRITSSEVS